MPRLAWFTPLPPTRSGIAQYNRELLHAIADAHDIDLFVDGLPEHFVSPDTRVRLFSAYDFIWKNCERPYDLIVYQLGNAPCHDYMWAYLTRFPGLVVLHDGQLHHARGRMLLQQRHPRRADYRREFWFNHPDANPDLAELGAVGLLGSLTYLWPMLRIVVESSRHVVVHNDWLAEQIRESHPAAAVDVVDMGVPEPASRPGARQQIRSRHRISEDAVVFTAFGKVTPEKRVREAMRALASVAETVPHAHLLIAGETVEYYDLHAEAETLGIGERVTFVGYLADEEIDDHLAASDVCLCMRWPTSRETSASWLRCLAAGKPTISTDLVHTVDVPTLDPRNWSVLDARLKSRPTEQKPRTDQEPPTEQEQEQEPEPLADRAGPVGASIDILDEGHSLKLAIRRLATDEKLRATLGSNARGFWAERFRLEEMVAGYQSVIAHLLQAAPERGDRLKTLPFHLRASGAEHAESIVKEILGSEYDLRNAD
jgi:glycosyltransferase involved in cell wall biosynthesis